ncbi:hypothetical protein BKA70DRAFT_1256972 [Coprinopsis sp. MPI-PUGE-AT-0042]|nr:hypothetical protein BKA70DRAFT_1256972 [Coprinopsis sp. MPI-PUGE-AT-0042]
MGACSNHPDTSRAAFPIVNQLAPELLSSIVLCCTPTTEEIKPVSHDTRIRILHTCQGWRNVALHYPPLWSFIVDTMPSRMALIIHSLRSRPSPISLYLTRDSLSYTLLPLGNSWSI